MPVSEFAVTVLTAWANSTPTQPWTNNPLGMPAHGNNVPRALNTPYALFPTMATFRDAFGRLLRTNRGASLADIVHAGDDLPAAWRAIHALGLPANQTETDYPASLLDMLEDDYRAKMATRPVAKRRTVGNGKARPEIHEAMRAQSYAVAYAARAFDNGSAAIAHIMRRLG
jgi:hypothetical protein